jgi:hypothetical protein
VVDQTPAPAGAPLYTRWWLWAGIATAAAIATTAVLVAGSHSSTVYQCAPTTSTTTGICGHLP